MSPAPLTRWYSRLPARRPRAWLAAAVAAGVVLAGAQAPASAMPVPGETAAPAAVAPPTGSVPHVVGTRTEPVYSYAAAIRESLWVQTPLDSDGDGVRDRVAIDLVRPREAAQAGVKVPVIMDASPYYMCCGRGNESEKKVYGPDGVVTRMPLFYDNYFVPRGYAVVAADLSGTSRSTGCMDVGGVAEVASAKAVVDWLNGRAPAFAADGTPVRAGWSTGKVGMIGKSWDGSVANGVAATGVRGLTTIVPISAISSWYGYMRFDGVLRSTGYPNYLHGYVNGRPAAACAALRARLASESADDTGDYNAYWQERDFRAQVRNVRASVFVAHGLNDLNVPTAEFAKWWDALADRGVPRKIWLYQAGHEDPFDVRRAEWVATLHRWFDFWLQGLSNGVMREPRATLETSPGTWRQERDWPAPDTRDVTLRLGAGDGTTGTLGRRAAPAGTVRSYQDSSLSEADLVGAPNTAKAGRLAFLSAPLTYPVRVSGSPSAKLRIRVDKPTTELTARLVDYGTAVRINQFVSEGVRTLTTESCWGEATTADDACYKDTEEVTASTDRFVFSRGWLDAAHHRTLRFRTPLLPDRWYTVTIQLDAHDTVLPAGHVLGLVLGQSDPDFTEVNDVDATVEVDLGRSTVTVPVAGRFAVPQPALAPVLPAAAADGAARAGTGGTRRIPDVTS